MNDVIQIDGKRYVSVDALRAACRSPVTTFNAAVCLRVGLRKNDPLHHVLGILLASYASQVAGDIPPLKPSPEQIKFMHQPIRAAKLEDMPNGLLGGGTIDSGERN